MTHQPNTPASLNALTTSIDALEILNRRPRPMCRDCADENGTCPGSGLPCDMAAVIRNARNALAAPGAAIDAREQEAINTARLAWLHTANKDAEGYEYGVCKVKYDEAGKLVSCLWTAGDSSDVDAAMSAACRPSKEWYAAKITETLDDDFAIGKAALASRQEAPVASAQVSAELNGAVASLQAAVIFTDQMRAAASAGEDVTATGVARDAREWLERAARTLIDALSKPATPSEALSPATVVQPVPAGYFQRSPNPSEDCRQCWEQVADEYKNDADVVPLYAALSPDKSAQ